MIPLFHFLMGGMACSVVARLEGRGRRAVVYQGEGEVYRERDPHPLPLLLLRGLPSARICLNFPLTRKLTNNPV